MIDVYESHAKAYILLSQNSKLFFPHVHKIEMRCRLNILERCKQGFLFESSCFMEMLGTTDGKGVKGNRLCKFIIRLSRI